MRKANKIMMITVSVLLCLVLFTSTALSGTLAKYSTSRQSGTASARVAKWGVTIDASVDTTKLNQVCPNTISNVIVDESGTNASIEITGLKMGPGDNLSDLIRFDFSGSPEVRVRVKLAIAVSYSQDNFKVPAGVGELAKERDIMPICLRFRGLDSSGSAVIGYTNVFAAFQDSSPNSVENTVMKVLTGRGSDPTQGMAGCEVGNGDGDSQNYYDYLYKDFEPSLNGTAISFAPNNGTGSITKFRLGFYYPLTYTSRKYDSVTLNTDEIGTWLARETYTVNDRTITPDMRTLSVKYTLSIEQITG